MLLALVLLVFETVGAQEPAPPPAPLFPVPTDVATIACSRCAAKTLALEPCLACDGTGRVGCGLCDPRWNERRIPWDERLDSDALARIGAKRRVDAEGGVFAKHSQAAAKLFGGRKREPGRAHCPLGTSDTAIPCRFCSGDGEIDCRECGHKGVRTCGRCAGKGKVERTCEACLGTALVPDALAIPDSEFDICPWCRDHRARVCGECSEGRRLQPCTRCLGEKTIVCTTCLGTRHAPCRNCLGTGRVAVFNGPREGIECPKCEKRGWNDCTDCDRAGKRACTECEGRGAREDNCTACRGDRVRPCAGCFLNGYAAWESAADVCERAGRRDKAANWLEAARRRVAECFDLQLTASGSRSVDIGRLGARRARESARLKERIDSLRAQTKQ